LTRIWVETTQHFLACKCSLNQDTFTGETHNNHENSVSLCLKQEQISVSGVEE